MNGRSVTEKTFYERVGRWLYKQNIPKNVYATKTLTSSVRNIVFAGIAQTIESIYQIYGRIPTLTHVT